MYYYPTALRDTLHIGEIYTIHYFEYGKNYVFGGERHDFWELLYVDKGQILVNAGNRSLVLQQGQLIFHEPNEFHSVAGTGMVAPNTIVISFSCGDAAMEALRGRICYVNEEERALLAKTINEARKAFSTNLGDPEYRKLELSPNSILGAEQLIRIYLEALLISLLRKDRYPSNRTTDSAARQRAHAFYFRVVQKFIEDNIDAEFSLKQLSQYAMVSASYLERIFRHFAGMGVIRYCNRCKIERAKQFIREDNMNISQIAEALGFSSIHYFSLMFKKMEGMAPSEYGRSVKSMEDHSPKVKIQGGQRQVFHPPSGDA